MCVRAPRQQPQKEYHGTSRRPRGEKRVFFSPSLYTYTSGPCDDALRDSRDNGKRYLLAVCLFFFFFFFPPRIIFVSLHLFYCTAFYFYFSVPLKRRKKTGINIFNSGPSLLRLPPAKMGKGQGRGTWPRKMSHLRVIFEGKHVLFALGCAVCCAVHAGHLMDQQRLPFAAHTQLRTYDIDSHGT